MFVYTVLCIYKNIIDQYIIIIISVLNSQIQYLSSPKGYHIKKIEGLLRNIITPTKYSITES